MKGKNSKNRIIVFNGKYMIKNQNRGVQRYTKEVLHAIDELYNGDKIVVLVPHSDIPLDNFKHLKVIQYGGRITSLFWQNLAFQWYVLKNRAFSVCLSDGVPLFRIGLYAIHDVRVFDDIKVLNKLSKKVGAYYSVFSVRNAAKNSKGIVTVSEFSKNEIINYLDITPEKISVCFCGWQHILRIETDNRIFDKYPDIKKNEYYFSLGGKEDNKNLRWVYEIANKYPDKQFVMAGPTSAVYLDGYAEIQWPENCLHVGFVSDGEMRSLMENCQAFLFPSKYEGFGIPPMEAMAVGAKVVMSNSTCLPEIYKNYVSYFDPDDYNVDLDALVAEEHPDVSELLSQYSWKITGKEILDLINKYEPNLL